MVMRKPQEINKKPSGEYNVPDPFQSTWDNSANFYLQDFLTPADNTSVYFNWFTDITTTDTSKPPEKDQDGRRLKYPENSISEHNPYERDQVDKDNVKLVSQNTPNISSAISKPSPANELVNFPQGNNPRDSSFSEPNFSLPEVNVSSGKKLQYNYQDWNRKTQFKHSIDPPTREDHCQLSAEHLSSSFQVQNSEEIAARGQNTPCSKTNAAYTVGSSDSVQVTSVTKTSKSSSLTQDNSADPFSSIVTPATLSSDDISDWSTIVPSLGFNGSIIESTTTQASVCKSAVKISSEEQSKASKDSKVEEERPDSPFNPKETGEDVQALFDKLSRLHVLKQLQKRLRARINSNSPSETQSTTSSSSTCEQKLKSTNVETKRQKTYSSSVQSANKTSDTSSQVSCSTSASKHSRSSTKKHKEPAKDTVHHSKSVNSVNKKARDDYIRYLEEQKLKRCKAASGDESAKTKKIKTYKSISSGPESVQRTEDFDLDVGSLKTSSIVKGVVPQDDNFQTATEKSTVTSEVILQTSKKTGVDLLSGRNSITTNRSDCLAMSSEIKRSEQTKHNTEGAESPVIVASSRSSPALVSSTNSPQLSTDQHKPFRYGVISKLPQAISQKRDGDDNQYIRANTSREDTIKRVQTFAQASPSSDECGAESPRLHQQEPMPGPSHGGWRGVMVLQGKRTMGSDGQYTENSDSDNSQTEQECKTPVEKKKEKSSPPPFKRLCREQNYSEMANPDDQPAAAGMWSLTPHHPPPNLNSTNSSPPAFSVSSSSQSRAAPSLDLDLQRQRYSHTREALERSGLLNLTVRLGQVIRTMQHYEQEVAKLRRDSHAFLLALLREPANAQVKEYLLQTLLASWKHPLNRNHEPPDTGE